jgi:hypothetical protein
VDAFNAVHLGTCRVFLRVLDNGKGLAAGTIGRELRKTAERIQMARYGLNMLDEHEDHDGGS